MIPQILEVQIQNYKSFGRAVATLEPFTVLVGPNGSGKSNFIDALAFLNDCLSESIELAFDKRGGFESVYHFYRYSVFSKTHDRIGIRVQLRISDESKAEYGVEFDARDLGPQPFVYGEYCRVTSSSGQPYEFEVRQGQFVKPIPGIRPKLRPDRLALFAASATDEFRPVYDFLTSIRSYAILPDRLREYQEPDASDCLKRDGSNAVTVLKQIFENSESGDNQEKADRLRALISKAIPYLRGMNPVTEGGKYTIEFFPLGGTRPGFTTLRALSMSDGTLRFLGLLLAVYQKGQHSVIAIEEPESTIHPAIAEMVTQVLVDASQERQILVTTHSADILDQKEISDEQIRAVTMEDGASLICPVSKPARDAIRERLYTPGELLRVDELTPDVERAKEMSKSIDLFGEPSQDG